MRTVLVLVLAACASGSGAPDLDAGTCLPNPEPSHPIYLNRTGGMFGHGGEDNSSINASIVLDRSVVLGAPAVIEGDWLDFVACVRTKYAPFNVDITETDPGADAHTELVVVDTAEQLGFDGNVASLANVGCEAKAGKFFDRAIAFLMWSPLDNEQRCRTAVQTLAQSFGLDHVLSCDDAMTTDNSCGSFDDQAFTNVATACSDLLDPCRCGDSTQNSFAHLAGKLGLACL